MNNLPPLRCNDHVSREIHKDRLKKYGGQRDSWLAFWKGLTNQSVWRSKTYSSIKSLFNLLFATRQDYFSSAMRSTRGRDISITWTSFLMKVVGLWLAADRDEQRRRDFALVYTVGALFIIVCIGFRDIYFTWGNFSVSIPLSRNEINC